MTDSALNIPYAARRECLGRGGRKGMTLSQREAARSALRSVVVLALAPVSYTHLTLPTTPYV